MSLVSSVFLMCLDTQVFVFGDCAIIPNPSPKELAEIAITSAQTAKQFNIAPKVALLSYATDNSAQGEMIDKINEALTIAQKLDPQLEIDGSLQFDASIDKSVAKKKMPNSQVAGQASVFIFPDLNAGNIAYKAVQRSAKAVAIGPILQGLNKPINDLSRGALAPLHNPANLAGIEFVQKAHPHIPQIAVFDTAFHASMPSYAYMYALPYELYEKYQIRRYGFHGTSHHYVAKEAAKFLNIAYEEFNAISLHLGNGSSAAAIQNGKSVDTSMGLTPLEGLIMGTRCGDIDPTVVEYIAQCANKSLEEVMKILNHESGLKGICGDNEKHRSQKGKRR